MDNKGNSWKLQDAKARFSELVRRARAGEPQHVTLHGKEAVVIVDAERFDVRPKRKQETLAGFVKRSKKYRAKDESEDVEFDQPLYMHISEKPNPFDKGEEP
jgi:prevent-host-death family protein